jgi:hypothetical protein
MQQDIGLNLDAANILTTLVTCLYDNSIPGPDLPADYT